MYIGGTDEKALHHLFAEVIDNSMDEAVAGHASRIDVVLGPDNRLTSEGESRALGCLERFGKRPLAVLDEIGWIAPDVWVAHGIHFDDAETWSAGAQIQARGLTLAPISGDDLGARLGLHHYPVLITATGIEQ